MNKLGYNFYPHQYQQDGQLRINHNYLPQQFSDPEPILEKIRELVFRADFTLGEVVDEFERVFSKMHGVKYGVGVGSGTDALFLSLKALDIGPGDEVITTPYTFYASVSAIIRVGAKPVFVDIADDYNIDPNLIPAAITKNTKAILPVHWSGNPCDMEIIGNIAKKNQLFVISDACHAVQSEYMGSPIGKFGDIACFSLHPLKNLNVWGDGGILITQQPEIAEKIALLRNHGLKNRDTCEVFAYNSRLDSLQAIVGLHLIQHQLPNITAGRINNATYLDQQLTTLEQIQLPERDSHKKHVYHLYMGEFSQRDKLQAFLIQQGIDAKIHYPTPLHLQPAAKHLGYEKGDFPRAERLAKQTLSLPVHEYIQFSELDYMTHSIKQFYGQNLRTEYSSSVTQIETQIETQTSHP